MMTEKDCLFCDKDNPRGGIRNIIPGKGDYTKKYYKVVTHDLKSVGLLGAPPVQYAIGEWTYPMEPLSDHPRKGGGLWAVKRRSDAFRVKKYIEQKHGRAARVFQCRIGIILHETSYRIKTDKVMLLEELK